MDLLLDHPSYIKPETVIYKLFSGPNGQQKHSSGALLMDVYPPQSDESESFLTPVVLIHGGAWNMGSTFEPLFRSWLTLLKNPRLRIFSIEHRLSDCSPSGSTLASPQNSCWPYPTPLEDVRDAIIYIKKNARQLKINPHQVILIGDSSGGHLALLHALKESKSPSSTISCLQAPLSPLCDARVAGVANFYAPVDFEDIRKNHPSSFSIIASLFNTTGEKLAEVIHLAESGTPLSDAEARLFSAYQDADIIRHIHSKMPPVFLSYTEADTLVPYSNFLNLLNRIQSVGSIGFIQKNNLHPQSHQALFSAILDTPAAYFPHAYLLAMGALGKSFYYQENQIEWDHVDPPKDLQYLLGLSHPKDSDPLKNLLDHLAHDATQYADAKTQLHKIDKNLRKWISQVPSLTQ